MEFKAVVEHDLVAGANVYTVGTTKITATFGCALNEWVENEAPECDVEVRLVAKTNVGDDDWVCLYEVLEYTDLHYFITGNKPLHVKGVYHKTVNYYPLAVDRFSSAMKAYHKEILAYI